MTRARIALQFALATLSRCRGRMSSISCADDLARGILGGPLSSPMQGFEKRHQRRCLGWTQVIPVSRHVAATLQHLADELVLREARGHGIQRWTALAACPIERVAVATLFALEHNRSLAFEGRPALYEFLLYRLPPPPTLDRHPT